MLRVTAGSRRVLVETLQPLNVPMNGGNVCLQAYRDGREARARLSGYFDFYNRRRLHQSLDHRTHGYRAFEMECVTVDLLGKNSMKKLRFASQYAGIFLGVDFNPETVKPTVTESSSCVLVYETVGRQLAFLIGDTHTESVSSVLDKWHDGARGSSFIGPIVSKLQLPPLIGVYVAIHALTAVPGSVLQTLAESEEIFAILSLEKDIVVLASGSPASLF